MQNSEAGSDNFGQLTAEPILNVKELLVVVFDKIWIVLAAGSVLFLAGLIHVMTLPDLYKSEAVFIPISDESSSQFGDLASKYSGLASFAGIDVGGESNRIEHAIEFANSSFFVNEFLNKYKLKGQLLAVLDWNKDDDSLTFDESVYNAKNNEWELSNDGDSLEPTMKDTFERTRKVISIKLESDSNLVKVSVIHHSPFLAKSILDLIIVELNFHFKEKDRLGARKKIEYLQKSIDKTSNTEMTNIFYRMIEAQNKTLMMTEVNSEYLFNELVPSTVADEKHKPNRIVMATITLVLSFFFPIVIIVLIHIIKQLRTENGI